MTDEIYQIQEAVEQLSRYGGTPYCAEFYDVLECLADLNDDLYNIISIDLCQEKANIIKTTIDKIMAIEIRKRSL